MSSSDGLKVVGISGMVATDIDDLVVATVIPGLGKDMADVQVRISAHLLLLIYCQLFVILNIIGES